MKSLIIYTALLFSTLLSCKTNEDFRKTLEQLDNEHQSCLDKGINMVDCSYQYTKQIDNLLDVVYKELLQKYGDDEKEKLRIEERKWIKQKEKNLKKIQAETNMRQQAEGFVPNDDKMIAYEEEASFTRDRLLVLINYYEKK